MNLNKIKKILRSLPSYSREELVACILEQMQLHVPYPPCPSTKEQVWPEQDEDYTAILNAALTFLTGKEPQSPDFGYHREQPVFTTSSDAMAAIVASLQKETGCFEALNLFEWPKLLAVLTASSQISCLWQLTLAAMKAEAFEQAFELVGVILDQKISDLKTLAAVLAKLSRWTNFVTKNVLEKFLNIFAAKFTGGFAIALMVEDPQGKWLRHWLAQTRVRALLGDEVVRQCEQIIT